MAAPVAPTPTRRPDENPVDTDATRLIRAASVRGTDIPTPAEPTGPRFRVLHTHARGGLGEVFLALDTRLGREVAVKQLKNELALDGDARARFIREAEVTGLLEHPGVVPVYDLGQKSDGHLYYAMRLIRGETLQQALNRFYSADGPTGSQRRLTFREFITRIIAVCNAIGYAHDRGILHRDLKPSNIMIGPYGETLVVDWGLAKRFDPQCPPSSEEPGPAPDVIFDGDDTGSTRIGDTLGTPAYMSPEQASGQPNSVGPLSDVYSLGATLAHVVTGRTPAPLAMPGFDRSVPAPLAAVCRKAMARRPGERYASAKAMADDLEHWLADEPVAACPESPAGKFARWCRRHRTLVISAVSLLIVAVIMLSADVVAVNQAWQRTELARQEAAAQHSEANAQRAEARLQRDDAIQQRKRTREALDAMTSNLAGAALSGQKSLTESQREFLNQILRYYQEFARESANDVDEQILVADAQTRLCQIQTELGNLEAARQAARDLLETCIALQGRHPKARHRLAQANLMLANILLDLGQWPEAESAALEAVCHFGAVAETDPAERAGLAAAHRTLSQLFSNRGQPTVALGHVQKAHDLREKISAEKPDDFEARWHLAAAQRDLSNQLTSLNRLDEAEKLVRRNLESRLKLAKEQPWNDAIQFSLAGAYGTLGVIQSRRDDSALPGSVDAFRQALTILDSVIAASPGTAVYRFEKLVALGNLSTVLTRQGKNAEALTIACAAVEIGRKLVSDFPLQLSLRMRLTAALNSLALATSDQGKHAEAEELYREAIGHHEWIARRVPDSVEEQVHFGGVYCNLSLLQSETGRAREGVVSSDRAIALLQPAAARTPPAAMAKRFLGNSYLARSQAREMIGDQKGALADVDAAIEQHGVSVSTSLRRAVLLARLGQLETALTIADDIVRINKLPPAFLVQAARVYALAGVDDADSRQRALDLLKKAASAGFRAGTAVTSTDFDSLSTEQAWPALRESLQTGRRNDA